MSTNAVSICQAIGLLMVKRIEASVRYHICFTSDKPSGDLEDRLVSCLHDRMTQCRYTKPIESFELQVKTEDVYDVDVIGQGRLALEKANKNLGEKREINLVYNDPYLPYAYLKSKCKVLIRECRFYMACQFLTETRSLLLKVVAKFLKKKVHLI